MKKKMTRLISLLVGILMVITSLPAMSVMAETDWTQKIPAKAEDGATFRLGVVSDSHIGTGSTAAKNLDVVLDAFDSLGVDAVAMNGDMVYAPAESDTENTKYVYEGSEIGIPAELYGAFKGFINANGVYTLEGTQSGDIFTTDTSKGKPIIYSMGNHEFPLNARTDLLEAASKNLYKEQTGRNPHHVMNVGGYTFIVGEPENYDLSFTDSEEFVKAQILAAEAADPSNKPIFYLQHEAVHKTVAESLSKASDNTESFKAFLNEHPRVIVLSGHTHSIIEDPKNIWQDGFTAIATSQLGGGNVSGGSASYSMGLDYKGSQAIMIDLTENKTEDKTDVKVYRMNLLTNEVIGTPYDFSIDGTTDTFKYNSTRYEKPSVANFKSGTSLTIDNTARQGFKFTFNTTDVEIAKSENAEWVQDDFVLNYRVVLENTDANIRVQNFKIFSDIFEEESSRLSSYSVTLPNQLDRGTNYKLSVYALTPFTTDLSVDNLAKKGVTPVVYEFKTSEELTLEDKALIRTHEDINVALNKVVKTGNPNHTEQAASQLTDGSYTTFVYADDGSNTDGSYIASNVTLHSGKEVECADGQKNDWLTVDLGRRYNISEVKLYPRASQTAYNKIQMRYFDIEASNTEDFKTYKTLGKVSSELDGNDCYTPYVANGDGNAYRYVRIKKTGNSSYMFGELEVFADVKAQEVSQKRQVSTNYYTPSTYNATYTVDGVVNNANKCWLVAETGKADDVGAPYNLVVDLEKDYPIGMIEMFSRYNSAAVAYRSNWKIYGYTNEQGNPGSDRDNYQDGALLYEVGASGYAADGLRAMINSNSKYRYIVFSKVAHQILAVGEVRAEVVIPKVMAAARVDEKTVNVSFTEKMSTADLSKENVISVATENGEIFSPSEIILAEENAWDGGYDAVLKFDESLPSAGLMLKVDGNLSTKDGATFVEDVEFPISGKSLAINKANKKVFENVNIALNKKVIAGNPNRTNASYLTDGESTLMAPATYVEGQTVTLPDGTVVSGATSNKDDWFIIDLGRRYDISEIKLFPRQDASANPVYISGFVIEGSNVVSAEKWDKLGGLENNDPNAPTDTSPYVIDDVKEAYRYIRLRKTVNTYHIYSELEIYADIEATNVAKGKNAVAREAYNVFTGDKTVDGIINYASNGWRVTTAPGADKTPNNLVIDLGAEYPLEMVEVHSNTTGAVYNRKIEGYGYNASAGKPDVTTNNSGATAKLFNSGSGVTGGYQYFNFDKGNYQYLVLAKTANEVVWLTEVQAYVVNPGVCGTYIDEDTITVKFTDKMDASTLTVNNFEIDGVTLYNPTYTYGFDGGYEVTFQYDGEIYDKMTLTVDETVRNQNGIEMSADSVITLETDIVKVTKNGVKVNKLTANAAHDIKAKTVATENVTAVMYVAVKDASGKVTSIAISDDVTVNAGDVLELSVEGITPKSGEKVCAYIWEKSTNRPLINIFEIK